MRTVVIGDVHGCGLELEELLSAFDKKTDQVVLVGDLFDRAKHGHLVWDIIQQWGDRIHLLCGNHERKMYKWLTGERPDAPPHYVWAVSNLSSHGIATNALVSLLGALPTILVRVWETGEIVIPLKNGFLKPGDVVIVHAGINVNWVLDPTPNYTVYGDSKAKVAWWDRYKGKNLVLYGHLSEKDKQVRLRSAAIEDAGDLLTTIKGIRVNSIGLDTSACHGGALTGYVIEEQRLVRVEAKRDWYTELKREMKDHEDNMWWGSFK